MNLNFPCIHGLHATRGGTGALPPITAGAITAAYGAFLFGLLLAVLCLISFLSAIGLPETRHRDLSDIRTSSH